MTSDWIPCGRKVWKRMVTREVGLDDDGERKLGRGEGAVGSTIEGGTGGPVNGANDATCTVGFAGCRSAILGERDRRADGEVEEERNAFGRAVGGGEEIET